MRLDTAATNNAGKRVDHVRLDLIGRTGGSSELWWVAREFDDGSTQPQGIFADSVDARRLADELAASLGVSVVITDFATS